MSKTYKPIKGAISLPDWDASIESPQRGRLIGYASGTYAEIPAQKAALEAAGCEVVYIDHDNGFRGGMEMMFESLGPGDILMVTRIDRLADNISQLQVDVGRVKRAGAYIKAIEQPINTRTVAGESFFTLLDIFKGFQDNEMKHLLLHVVEEEDTSIDVMRVFDMWEDHRSPSDIAQELGVSVGYVNRVLSKGLEIYKSFAW